MLSDDYDFQRRMLFIRSFPHVGYLRPAADQGGVGCSLDVADLEISALLNRPGSSPMDIVDLVKTDVLNGFCDGKEFIGGNLEQIEFFRKHLSRYFNKINVEAANLFHIQGVESEQALPDGKKAVWRSQEEANALFGSILAELLRKIKLRGDTRNVDVEAVARDMLREGYEEFLQDSSQVKNPMEAFRLRYGVDLRRLPKKPRVYDYSEEFLFMKKLGVHAQRLRKNLDELSAKVRKEQLPSWLVHNSIKRKLKTMPHVEVGNMNDMNICEFGPYVDVLNVDKRISEMIKQCAKHSDLFKLVLSKVPLERGFTGLVSALKDRI